eukprot:TRINITY_DN37565_c0_g1_i1.p1 TRINITY_DN37565_c0_g1~~TRINITY_DN37565_c0_g1_i1.p1  ORF type:complete len:925 (-),score=143.48 TRINITY_DN37565_c0_g1_i1:85-2859(-)
MSASQNERTTLFEYVKNHNHNRLQETGHLQDKTIQRIRWVEWGKEHTSDFCEATDPSGLFESNSSQGHKEYQDRLKAIALREEGLGKAEIAATLGRSEKFVQNWWRKEPKQVPKPAGVHEYLKTEYWRDVQIVRGFGKGLGIYDEVLQEADWQQQMAWGNDFRNGGRVVKYDKEGRMRPMGNQQAKGGYEAGRMPNLDKVTQKMLSQLDIQDRVLTRPGLLWYPDGTADAIPHRHECWTALLSFGAPRILTIDGAPVLLRDGDLIVFGTQRHGVPRMHPEGEDFDSYGGRISTVFFFMPQGELASGANPWRPIFDQEDAPSRQLTAWQKDKQLGSPYEREGLMNGELAPNLKQLMDLGFAEKDALVALKAADQDLDRAAEILLSGGASLLLEYEPMGKREQLAALYSRLESLHGNACGLGCSMHGTACEVGDLADLTEDEALARRVQQEDSSLDEEQLILTQIEELEREVANEVDQGTLQAQFAQYDEMLDRADASEWDGRGDLMAFMSKREHLHIEQQDPATLLSFGTGRTDEKDFYELLSLHSVRVLYDLRANAESAVCNHFQPRNLTVACKARAIIYRHVALGRDGAYGIMKHLREDEGRNTLAELVWQAHHKKSAFLGAEEDWRSDHRQAIATRLSEAGHCVQHILSDGSPEEHPKEFNLPDFILGEETRLRTLEKQKLADPGRVQKSAVHRSTESVAQKMMKPQQVIDAGEELRKATNQTELCRIQRRLADLQRRSEGVDAKAGLGPKLVGVNKWVKEEAEQQRENLAQGKRKDGQEKLRPEDLDKRRPGANVWLGTGGTSGGNPVLEGDNGHGGSSSSSCQASAALSNAEPATLVVECRACNKALPWTNLEMGDGICVECARGSAPIVAASSLSTASCGDEPTSAACSSDLQLQSTTVAPKSSWRSKRHQLRASQKDE